MRNVRHGMGLVAGGTRRTAVVLTSRWSRYDPPDRRYGAVGRDAVSPPDDRRPPERDGQPGHRPTVTNRLKIRRPTVAPQTETAGTPSLGGPGKRGTKGRRRTRPGPLSAKCTAANRPESVQFLLLIFFCFFFYESSTVRQSQRRPNTIMRYFVSFFFSIFFFFTIR